MQTNKPSLFYWNIHIFHSYINRQFTEIIKMKNENRKNSIGSIADEVKMALVSQVLCW